MNQPTATEFKRICTEKHNEFMASDAVKALIEDVSPHGIKKNDIMRQKIKNEMNELKFAIDAAIEDMPRRKIRMAS